LTNSLRNTLNGLVLVFAACGVVAQTQDSILGQTNQERFERELVQAKDLLTPMTSIQAQAYGVQSSTVNQGAVDAVDNASLISNAGVVRMQEIIKAIQSENYDVLDERTRQAIVSAKKSAEIAAGSVNMDTQTATDTVNLAASWHEQLIEAYIAALPPRDQALGRSVLAGDGTIPNSEGKLYFFVSRSMPASLLKAYALDALYTGAALVVKGIRKGETVKDYLMEVMEDYNSVDGQILAGMEINPNLFDMFEIDVVPAVVWTNRGGLDDIGSGCVAPPDFAIPTTTVQGPDFSDMIVEKPTCLPVAESAYYKISGALKLEYVLERFGEAGAPAFAMGAFADRLAQRHANVFQGEQQPTLGNAMPELPGDITVDRLPRHVLQTLKDNLEQFNVRRSPYGPAFGDEDEDDPVYRQELMEQVQHGLGL